MNENIFYMKQKILSNVLMIVLHFYGVSAYTSAEMRLIEGELISKHKRVHKWAPVLPEMRYTYPTQPNLWRVEKIERTFYFFINLPDKYVPIGND